MNNCIVQKIRNFNYIHDNDIIVNAIVQSSMLPSRQSMEVSKSSLSHMHAHTGHVHTCKHTYIYMHTCIGYITRWRSLRDLHTEGRRPEAV